MPPLLATEPDFGMRQGAPGGLAKLHGRSFFRPHFLHFDQPDDAGRMSNRFVNALQ